ncbi:MAG: PAS domain S-box protein, partial [Sandaracinaceae bacterium]|nr:PAS domain S-box protein [Sandaracinaceae bacterium]
GYSVESLRGRSVLEIVHPDDAIMITNHLSAGAGVPGYSVTVTVRVRHASGEWRELEVSGINLRDDDVIHGLLVHGRDVTERNRAQAAAHERERAYSLVLQNLSGMAYRFSITQETWLLVTEGCEPLLGYTKDELVQGRGPALPDLVSPEDRSSVRERREAAVLSGKPYSLEHRVQTRAGKTRWVLDVGRGVRNAGGALVVEGFMTDVTSRKRLEEELTHSQRLDGLGRLAGGIAHDFNNLLAAMLGYASIVLEDLPAGSPSRDDVQQIVDAANRAAELTRQLLAFARKQVIQPRALDLGEVVLGLDRLRRRVLREDIELVTRPCPDLWPVQADPSQIEQVLLNLAVNARDAMPAGGTLTIETCNATFDSDYAESHAAIPAGEYVMLAVSDTGVGMEPEILRHVFEPFFTTKDVGRGTGLGLATCYGIVAQAGGHILVYSEPGRGTTFKIYLPRGASSGVVEARAAAEVRSSEGTETILVVEDHPMLRDVSARALRAQGYRVLIAAHGADALRVLEAEPGRVDLLLTDVVMPSMGGHELADRVRALCPGIRVLYVSGYTDNSVIQHGVPQSGVAFLAKPFTPAVLCAKVREVLDS